MAGPRARHLLLLLPLLVSCSLFEPPPPPRPVAVDYWTYEPLIASAEARAALYAHPGSNTLRQVYLESGYALEHNPDGLAEFIADADAHGVQVMLLVGDSTWVFPEKQAEAVAMAERAVSFVEKLKTEGKPVPTGIQFDVEPHALPEWDAQAETLMVQLVDLLEKLRAVTAGKIGLALALPFWYDGLVIERGGNTRVLSELAQDLSDTAVLMDYRDRLELALAAANNEVNYARATRKKVIVGFESACYDDPSLKVITYCEEGRKALDLNLQYLNRSYEGTGALDGVAVFSLETYRKLRE